MLQLENSPDEDLVPDLKADLRVLPAQELPLSALCVGGGRALVAVDFQCGLVNTEPNELLRITKLTSATRHHSSPPPHHGVQRGAGFLHVVSYQGQCHSHAGS